MAGCEELETPVIAPHRAALRILEVAWPGERKAELATNGVRRTVVDRRVGVQEAVPLLRSRTRDRLEGRRSRDSPPLEVRHHRPADLVDLLTLPFAVLLNVQRILE